MFRRALTLLALLGAATFLITILSCTTLPPVSTFSSERPLSDFATSSFVGSGKCAVCHGDLVDEKAKDVSIHNHWRSTMMANAAKDPLFLAKMSSEAGRSPTIKDVAQDKCATCHMPMARTQAYADGEATTLLDGGFLDPNHKLSKAALDGVSCTACHQIQDAALGQKESFGGYYRIDTALRPPYRIAYGPYSDPLEAHMQAQSGFTPVEGAHIGNAALCATCHNVYTPFVDAEGQVGGEFPEQVTYLEWKQSTYGDSTGSGFACQKCHMPAAQSGVVISTEPRGSAIGPRSPFSQHQFAGGNAFMLKIHKAFGNELGLTANEAHLDATLTRTLDRLENSAAQVSIIESEIVDDKLSIVVEVSSWAGHKLPTGFPSRRAWVHLAVTGSEGNVVFESGRPQKDGSISGSAADRDPVAFEPHYDRITDPDQVQIYESVMENTEGDVTYTLLRGATYAKDNRLLPGGFDKANAHGDTAVHGAAAADENFVGGSDQITYQIDLGKHSGPYGVSARLLYQSVSHRFAMDLFAEEGPLIERMSGYFAGADHTPVIIADDQASVP